MKRAVGIGVKLILFLIVVALSIGLVDRVLMAKYLYDQSEPQTETYEGFYGMKRNTVDVLILGSSHAACGFNPQDLYDRAGIRSYNLSCSSQTIWKSYYWLKEALRYQSPSVVVLDCYYWFESYGDSEPAARKALDSMQAGEIKYEAVKTAIEKDRHSDQSALSYFLPFIRYHSRWKELKEGDFYALNGVEKPSQLKGFWIYHRTQTGSKYKPLKKLISDEPAAIDPDALEYMDKILELCRENDIHLVLVKTPLSSFRAPQHTAVQAFAEEHGLSFYDFNDAALYEACGFVFNHDMDDFSKTNAHANPSGARKMSYFLADELLQSGWVEPHEDEQWSGTRLFNDNTYKDFQLRNETNLDTYLELIDDDRYTVFIVAKDEASTAMTSHTKVLLSDLGLQASWDDAYRCSYAAIIDRGTVTFEEMSPELIAYSTSFRNGLSTVQLESAGHLVGNRCSVRIDGQERTKSKRGLNFVVYNNERRRVIDCVRFDTFSEGSPASR